MIVVWIMKNMYKVYIYFQNLFYKKLQKNRSIKFWSIICITAFW